MAVAAFHRLTAAFLGVASRAFNGRLVRWRLISFNLKRQTHGSTSATEDPEHGFSNREIFH